MVGDRRQMRRRVPGLALADPPAIDQGDGLAGALQQIRRGEAGNAAADHDDVDMQVAGEVGIVMRSRFGQPEGNGLGKGVCASRFH